MNFKISAQHLEGFKIWLSLLGYKRKDLEDGGCTFKGKGTKHEYVLLTANRSGNPSCKALYNEYRNHLMAPELSGTLNPSIFLTQRGNV